MRWKQLFRGTLFTIALVAVQSLQDVALANSGSGGKERSYKNLDQLRRSRIQQLEKYGLDNGDSRIIPVKEQLVKLLNNKATEQDIDKIVAHMKQLISSGKARDIAAASNLSELLYLFENDLKAAYFFTKKTGRVFTHVFRVTGTPNKINTKLIESISDENLTKYYVHLIVEHLKKDTEKFYSRPDRPVKYWVPMGPLRVLIHLPQTAQSKHLLLNYPFEKHTWIWHYHVNDFPSYHDRMPDNIAPDYPKDPLKWYYREIIRGTSLAEPFEQKLRRRDLLNTVKKDTANSPTSSSSD